MKKPSKNIKLERYQVISTTDGKYIGCTITKTGSVTTDQGVVDIVVDALQNIDDKTIRLSNSNYIIEARKI